MKPVITNDILYIGADDTTIDLFESQYPVPEGVSYNSYLILDDKITVMDTVDARGTDTWLANLKEGLNGKSPDYLVISHLEPDHAANIGNLAEMYPNMKLIGNAKTFSMLPLFFHKDYKDRQVVVKEGDTVSLGKHALQFFMAPMVHWPEVMVTYEQSQKILFSADGFGKFGALCKDDPEDWACEARRYYFNIVGKYGVQVQALLKKAAALDISMICPLHGPVLKENLGYYIGLYDTWSSYKAEKSGVALVYASIHGNTAEAAKKLAEMVEAKGEKVDLLDASRTMVSELIESAFEYDRMILAAATYDGGIFSPMEDFIHHLQAKGFQNRKIGLMENGSWGPVAAKKMRDELEKMKDITFVDPVVTIKGNMSDDDLPQLEALAAAICEK
ncbi:MAG: FprA family A-type flavoprotein [Roseburia sp.]|nr:FprA family A-type flavoprotein [Roseburia sp.]